MAVAAPAPAPAALASASTALPPVPALAVRSFLGFFAEGAASELGPAALSRPRFALALAAAFGGVSSHPAEPQLLAAAAAAGFA